MMVLLLKIGAIADAPDQVGRLERQIRVRKLEESGVDSLWAGIHVRSEGFTTAGLPSSLVSGNSGTLRIAATRLYASGV